MRSRQEHESRIARTTAAMLAVAALAAGGCEDEVQPPLIRTLNGPTAMTFACYGPMRVTQGQAAAADQPVVTSPMPLAACRGWDDVSVVVEDDGGTPDETGDDVNAIDVLPPEGQGPIGLEPGDVVADALADELFGAWQSEIALYGFVLQKSQGTVAVVRDELGASNVVALEDADPFAPGRNVIPVGSQPVGIVTEPSGCHVMTANAGSCDLSVIDVAEVLGGGRASVGRVTVRDAAGERLAARPRDIAIQAGSGALGFECADQPDSLVYVAYPDCNAVAVIHAGTGEIRAGIVFDEDGQAVLTDGNLSCAAATCGGPATPPVAERPDAGPPDAGMPDEPPTDPEGDPGVDIAAFGGRPRPVAVNVADDGSYLYIGAENSAQLTAVALDDTGLPADVWSAALEGEVGVTRVASTALVGMGGDIGRADERRFGDSRFVYAIATDNTVRVIDVHDQRRECDTQVDPRFIHDVTDGQLLACLPVDAFPRRVGARSPGIHMPGNARPLDVAFALAPGLEVHDVARPPIAPNNLIGYFAYISLSTGLVAVVNVDDDNYPDFEDAGTPVAVHMPLAIPHQLRDGTTGRRDSLYCTAADENGYADLTCDFSQARTCAYPTANVTGSGVPRLASPSAATSNDAFVSGEADVLLPELRALECVSDSAATPVPELSAMVPDPLREAVFPDIQSVRNETWSVIWEGQISRRDLGVSTPPVRVGFVELDGSAGTMTLHDGGAPFCEMGAEPGDVVTLLGCNTSQGESQCRTGEVCVALDGTSDQAQHGICVREDRAGALRNTCADFLASERRFLVLETRADRLVLAERPRALRTTPQGGCTSDQQCAALATLEQQLAAGEPLAAVTPATTGAWSCEPAPAGDPDRNVCLMTCGGDGDCEDGLQCSGGYCVEAALPPAECVAALQRYDTRVGNTFAVFGSIVGFLHQRMADDSGVCIDDPEASPLAVGRVPLAAPPCAGDGMSDLAPNPCATTVEQVECAAEQNGLCTATTTRQAPALRFRTPSFTTHLVDPVIDPAAQGISCTIDGEPCPPFPAVFPGYSITFTLTGGFTPLFAGTPELRYPVGLSADPLNGIWVMDQGELSAAVRGQVIRFSPLTLDLTAVVQ